MRLTLRFSTSDNIFGTFFLRKRLLSQVSGGDERMSSQCDSHHTHRHSEYAPCLLPDE